MPPPTRAHGSSITEVHEEATDTPGTDRGAEDMARGAGSDPKLGRPIR